MSEHINLQELLQNAEKYTSKPIKCETYQVHFASTTVNSMVGVGVDEDGGVYHCFISSPDEKGNRTKLEFAISKEAIQTLIGLYVKNSCINGL